MRFASFKRRKSHRRWPLIAVPHGVRKTPFRSVCSPCFLGIRRTPVSGRPRKPSPLRSISSVERVAPAGSSYNSSYAPILQPLSQAEHSPSILTRRLRRDLGRDRLRRRRRCSRLRKSYRTSRGSALSSPSGAIRSVAGIPVAVITAPVGRRDRPGHHRSSPSLARHHPEIVHRHRHARCGFAPRSQAAQCDTGRRAPARPLLRQWRRLRCHNPGRRGWRQYRHATVDRSTAHRTNVAGATG
jgi:hypothetical protein